MDLKQNVSSEFYFYLAGGRVVKNVEDLLDALKETEDWVFEHHVNSERNDFSRWIQDIYCDRALATALRRCKKKASAIKTLEKSLKKKAKLQKLQEKKQQKLERKQQKLEEKQQRLQEKSQLQKSQQEEQEKSNSKKINPPKKKRDILSLLKKFY